MTKKNNYSGESIQILKGLDAVRKRHSMYLGSLDEMTNQLAKEVIDNANDEFARGYATDTWVYLDTKLNQLTVIDNGRGLPTDIHPTEGIPTMEVIFGTLHSGTNFDDNNSDHTAGTNGVGSSSTNAMSTMFRAESIRNGYIYSIEFSEGKVTKKFSKRKRKENEYPEIQETGTVIKFIPDETIIKEFHKFNPSFLKENLHIRAYVNAGLRTHLKIDDNKMIDYYHEDGIKDLLETMVNKPFSKPYYFKETDPKTGDTFEVAFQYDSNSDENIKSFVNGIVTSKGKHLTGFKMGLTNSITKFMEEKNIFTKKINKDSVSGDDIRSGLVCIINAKMKNALYSSQTKDELTNPEVFGLLSKYTNQNITQFASENEKDFKTITGRIIKFTQGRMNANKYKDSVVKTSVGLSLQFSNNFNPCAEKDPSKIELIIVEGKSAGTSISGGRDPLTQAYYTLRGKIKNVYGVRHSNLVSNEEINELMLIVFGTNKPSELSEADSRYGSIIFTCDADDDGAHINSLLMQLFSKFPRLFQKGIIKVAKPPKYRFDNGRGNFTYLSDEQERFEFEYNKAKDSINVKSDINLSNLLKIKNNYMTEFNNIINKYSISEELLSNIAHPQDINNIEEILQSIDPSGNIKLNEHGSIIGIYDGIWHDIEFNLLLEEIETLKLIYPSDYLIEFEDGEEIYLAPPFDFFNYIDNKFKFKYDYFKG